MKRVFRITLILGLSSALMHAVMAAPPSSDLPVTSNLEGNGVNTVPTLRIQSDGLGFYRNTKTEISNIQSVGAWVLDMYNTKGSTRTVLVDLRDAIGSATAPFEYQQVKARLIARCNVFNVSMLNMYGVGSNITCPLAVEFDNGGNSYRLVMNYDNFAETQPASVTCTGVKDPAHPATSQCNQWKIEPWGIQPGGERKSVAKLLRLASRPNQSDQDLGDFYMSFVFDVTNP